MLKKFEIFIHLVGITSLCILPEDRNVLADPFCSGFLDLVGVVDIDVVGDIDDGLCDIVAACVGDNNNDLVVDVSEEIV